MQWEQVSESDWCCAGYVISQTHGLYQLLIGETHWATFTKLDDAKHAAAIDYEWRHGPFLMVLTGLGGLLTEAVTPKDDD